MAVFKIGERVVIIDDYGWHSGHVGTVLDIEEGTVGYLGPRHIIQCQCGKKRGFTTGQIASLGDGAIWLKENAQGYSGNREYQKGISEIIEDLRKR